MKPLYLQDDDFEGDNEDTDSDDMGDDEE